MKPLCRALGLIIGSASLVLAANARATTHEGFYAGKRLQILVSSAPGGGNDIRARLLGRHLSKHIPARPAIIIQNMPGGGHVIMNNYLNNIAKPDGLTIGQTVRGIYWYQLMGYEEARFDLTKVQWIGSTSGEDSTLVVRSDLGYRSLADVRKAGKNLVLGCTGTGTSNYIYGQILVVALDVPVKWVCGYPGTSAMKLAIHRGEVEGMAGRSIANLLTIDKEEVGKGFWFVLVQSGEKRHPAFANVPTKLELAPTQEAKGLIRAATADAIIGWPFYVAGGVPAEQVRILRKAFMDTMRDSEFLQEAEKMGVEIDPTPGEELERVVKDALQVSPAMLRKLRIVYHGSDKGIKKGR